MCESLSSDSSSSEDPGHVSATSSTGSSPPDDGIPHVEFVEFDFDRPPDESLSLDPRKLHENAALAEHYAKEIGERLEGLRCEACGAPADALHLNYRGAPDEQFAHNPRAACPRHDLGEYWAYLKRWAEADFVEHVMEKIGGRRVIFELYEYVRGAGRIR